MGKDGQDGEDYVAAYAYDLVGNRHAKVFDSASDNLDETVAYAYNDRDEVTAEDSSRSGNDVGYTYDANGSTLTQTKGGQTVKYVWDLRNRMVGLDSNGDNDTHDAGDAEYAYDSAGVRVSKTLDPTAATESVTLYVVDDANPTGYAQPVEAWTDGAAPALAATYLIGDRVYGQAGPGEENAPPPVQYLQADGHGSTRLMTDGGGGAVVAGGVFNYDAFGGAVGFAAASAGTEFQWAWNRLAEHG